MNPRLLALALALAAARPAAGADLSVSDRPIQPDEVPPGSHEDQELYASLRNGTADLMREMRGANEALQHAALASFNLDALEKTAPDGKQEVDALRARVQRAVGAITAAAPKKPLAGCRYTLLHLEDSMIAEAGTDAAKRLPQKRKEAQECDRDIRKTLPGFRSAVAELREELGQVAPEIGRLREKALPAGPAPAAGTPASSASSARVPAAAAAPTPAPEARP